MCRNINRALAQMVEDGVIPASHGFPWGVDRVYYDEHGDAQFRVRRLSDGRKQVFDAFPPFHHRYFIPKKQRRLKLRQEDWRYEFAPGDEAIRRILIEMFRGWYIQNKKINRIAAELNGRGVLTPWGKMWSKTTVKQILENPVYLGISVGGVETSGVLGTRHQGAPIMHPMPRTKGFRQDGKGRRKRVPAKLQPPSSWMLSVQPQMADFLPPDVKEAFLAEWQRKLREGWSRPPEARVGKSPHVPSSYFLSKIVKIKSDDCPLVGSTGGEKNAPIRYYRTSRDTNQPKAGRAPERVRADVLEHEVKGAMKLALEDFEGVEWQITEALRKRQHELLDAQNIRDPLLREKAELERRYKDIFDVSSPRGQVVLRDRVKQIEVRLEQIDAQLVELGEGKTLSDSEIIDIVESVKEQFLYLKSTPKSGSDEELHRLAEVFVPKLMFDPDTRTIEMEIALPTWALDKKKLIQSYVGTGATLGLRTCPCTTLIPVVLLRVSCKEFRTQQNQPPCLICQRPSRLAA
jgi:hypothetical protein